MKFEVAHKSPVEIACDMLVVGAFEGAGQADMPALDDAGKDALLAQAKRERFEGKPGQLVEFTPGEEMAAHKVLLIGLGKRDEFNLDGLRSAISGAIKRGAALSAKRVAIASFGVMEWTRQRQRRRRSAVCVLATYKYLAHKNDDAKPCPIETVTLLPSDATRAKAARKGIERGKIIAEAICFARDLVNSPANVVTPSHLADQAT